MTCGNAVGADLGWPFLRPSMLVYPGFGGVVCVVYGQPQNGHRCFADCVDRLFLPLARAAVELIGVLLRWGQP